MGPAYHKGGPMSLGVPENPIDRLPKPLIFQGKKPLAVQLPKAFPDLGS